MDKKLLMTSFYKFVNNTAESLRNGTKPFDLETVNGNLNAFAFDKVNSGLKDDDAATILKELGFKNTDANLDGKTDVADVSYVLCNQMQPGMGTHLPDNKFDLNEAQNTLMQLTNSQQIKDLENKLNLIPTPFGRSRYIPMTPAKEN